MVSISDCQCGDLGFINAIVMIHVVFVLFRFVSVFSKNVFGFSWRLRASCKSAVNEPSKSGVSVATRAGFTLCFCERRFPEMLVMFSHNDQCISTSHSACAVEYHELYHRNDTRMDFLPYKARNLELQNA